MPTATQCAVPTAAVPTAWGGCGGPAQRPNGAVQGGAVPGAPAHGWDRHSSAAQRPEGGREKGRIPSRDTAQEELKISTDNKPM